MIIDLVFNLISKMQLWQFIFFLSDFFVTKLITMDTFKNARLTFAFFITEGGMLSNSDIYNLQSTKQQTF